MKCIGRKKLVLLILGLVLILGATSLFADDSNYRSYLYATKAPAKYTLSKDFKVLVFIIGFDYQWENTLESAIQVALKKQGIKSEIVSDYIMMDYSLPLEDMLEEAYDRMTDLGLSMFEGQITGYTEELSTYEYGGGVAELTATFLIASLLYTDGFLTTIEISTEAKTNNLESLRATRVDACESMAEKLVERYVSLITDKK